MKKIKLVCVSDLHGHTPKDLPDGDILVIAGDLTASDTKEQHWEFIEWLGSLSYKDIILVPGNHDVHLESHEEELRKLIESQSLPIHLLIDEAVTVQGLRFWGCPWTPYFPDVNPKCTAFMVHGDAAMMGVLMNMPDDIDVYVGHGPPYGILDLVPGERNVRVGSEAVFRAIARRHIPVNIFGHLHNNRGSMRYGGLDYYNVAYVGDDYKPNGIPIEVIEIYGKSNNNIKRR